MDMLSIKKIKTKNIDWTKGEAFSVPIPLLYCQGHLLVDPWILDHVSSY